MGGKKFENALKLPDLNTTDIEAAVRTVEGAARSMGLEVV